MGDGLTREVDRLEELWNDWEIRGAIVVSFLIQMLLLVTAGYRKRNYGLNLKAVSMSIFLWLEYLFADSVAIFALGYLSQNEGQVSHLVILWAPFLLLHLGGQDTITALSIEDNELWKRHLQTFISQACIAMYVFAKSGRPSSISWAGSFIFFAGIVKYVERIWALQKASMSSLRSSCTMESDKVGKYLEYMASKFAEKNDEDYGGVVCTAYELSQMMMPIFADLTLNFVTWQASRRYFSGLEAEKAYKVIELELYFMYDMLHTKAAVLHKWYGWLFRVSTLICTITALVIFTMSNRIDYHKIEVGITYLLLVGAVVLESSSLAFMSLSLRTYAGMKEGKKCTNWLKQGLMVVTGKLRLEEKSEWANCMGQCSLLNYTVNCKTDRIGNMMSFFGVKENWDIFWHTDCKHVEPELKELVLSELRRKIPGVGEVDIYEGYRDQRGEIAMIRRQESWYEKLGWSIVEEFDRSILTWHLATDILVHYNEDEEKIVNKDCSYRNISEDISKYMLFILIARPFMLPRCKGQIRLRDTCGHVKAVELRRGRRIPQILKGASIAELMSYIKFDEESMRHEWRTGEEIFVEHSMSILLDGVKLAQQLQEFFKIEAERQNFELMWKLISGVWVEMLCFAASKCGGSSHTKQLSMGGEFLTHVYFLMAHMGIGEEHRFGDSYHSDVRSIGSERVIRVREP